MMPKSDLLRMIFVLAGVVMHGSMLAQTPFVDITDSAGIDHKFEVFEGMFGGGAAVIDFDKDGYEDLFITSGMQQDVLYHNNGNGTFTDVYIGSGLEETQHYVTQGVAVADVNKDGWVDIFVTTITSKDSIKVIPREKNLLFLNNGNGTFKDVTDQFGLGDLNSFSTGASFGDVNLDGYPDLYVGNYFIAYEGSLSQISDATIVGANQTSKDYLLLNNSGNNFKDGYSHYDLSHKGFGFGATLTDFDNDRDLDVLVNNDFGYKAESNYFFQNQYPEESFTEISEMLDLDLKINAMGTAIGDYNGDGYLDYYVTNIRFNHFMVNNGPKMPFTNMTRPLGMNFVSISWGANFTDFDHDGDVDLFVSNGDLNPNCVPMANFYFENENGQFTDQARAYGLADYGVGRGSVVFDMENDGDMDILVVNQIPVLDYPTESRTKLFRNDLADGNWMKVRLRGTSSDFNGIGARVELVVNDQKMIREIDGGGASHLSQNSSTAHFGLAEVEMVDTIKVIWNGGKEQILTQQLSNQLLVITEIENDNNNKQSYVIYALGMLIGGLVLLLIFKRRSTARNH
ncbi:MAG: CRTAC1 family protein [Cyclobacteriaceae bacterium]